MTDPARTSGITREEMQRQCRIEPCYPVKMTLEGNRNKIPCVVCVHEGKLPRMRAK